MKLYEYFGLVGILSVAAWMAAIAVLAVWSRRRRRHPGFMAAIGLAVLAAGLARINSDNVSAIQMDREDEMAVVMDAQQKARETVSVSEGGRIVAPVRFAEDAPGESLDTAGKRAEPKPAPATTNAAPPTPAYRMQGKQEREAGKKQPVPGSGGAAIAETQDPEPRTMKPADVAAANRLDRLNLLAVHLVLLICLAMLAWDYLLKLNTTAECYMPLPIAGLWLDAVAPKTRVVRMRNADTDRLRQHLERVARKGETFLLLGAADPWPGRSSLPRLPWQWRVLPRLPKIVYGAPGVPADPEFLFDAVWFNRYCVHVGDSGDARRLLPALVEYLRERHATGAFARSTVTVVWALPEDTPALLGMLARLCRTMNWKLLVAGSEERTDLTFDEILD